MDNPVTGERVRTRRRREWAAAAALVAAAAVIAFWEVMANRSRRPFEPFQLTAADFSTFQPLFPDAWRVQRLPVTPDPLEPNIVAFALEPAASTGHGTVWVRLSHGYNMVDCMRLKGYTVELLKDTRRPAEYSAEYPFRGGHETFHGLSDAVRDGRQFQLWRVVSADGETSIWVTSMLRAGDFAETSVDTRRMPFPQIGTPDDPGWLPRGITLRSLRRPVRNFRLFLRAKWNNSRRDIATFLNLKQPAWASRDLLTLVARTRGPSVRPEQESDAARQVLAAHALLYSELLAWQRVERQREAL